ncbi:MAG: hypothetical protein ACFE75_06865 [Candidatus Hodarchaeota archaeon]
MNLSEYGKFLLDDKPLNFTKENINIDIIQNLILIYHKGTSYNLNEILEGKFSGRTIALGDSLSILINLDKNSLEMFTKGKHSFRIESDLISNLEIIFELDESNMNIRFDPDNT